MVTVITPQGPVDGNASIAAADNRSIIGEKGIIMISLTGGPGAGKTTLLEKTLPLLNDKFNIAVINVNSNNDYDAEKLLSTGVMNVVQINIQGDGGLSAYLVSQAIEQMDLDPLDLIFVENTSNTLSADVDLGENYKIFVASVEDGMDGPEKYAPAFRDAFAAAVTKIDLLPHGEFNLGTYICNLMELNNDLKIFPISAEKNEGIEEWGQLIGRMLWKGRRHIGVN